jgi:Xaa-Pro dipeptidase
MSAPTIDEILAGKYPAKQHAENVARRLRSEHPDVTDGIILLSSQKTTMLEDCDQEAPFRQRRHFFYLSGCNLADSFLTYDMQTQKLTLYIPPVNADEVIWSGLPESPEEALEKYDVDDVRTTPPPPPTGDLASRTVFAYPPVSPGPLSESLKLAIDTLRATKDAYEVALIRKANEISALAHHACLRAVKTAKNERELAALFTQVCTANAAPTQAYEGIFASGTAAATLHYVRNDQPLAGKQLLLLDAGAEVRNYASDVTRTFPINGTFTNEADAIYRLVLSMQTSCLAAIRPGVLWEDVHALAHTVAIDGLRELGILVGSPEDLLASRASVAFFPHGLGHYLGLDTHDTAGNRAASETDEMFRYLRKRGELAVGDVITVEPGIYFCRFIIDRFVADPVKARFVDMAVVERYWDVGGVRIEGLCLF